MHGGKVMIPWYVVLCILAALALGVWVWIGARRYADKACTDLRVEVCSYLRHFAEAKRLDGDLLTSAALNAAAAAIWHQATVQDTEAMQNETRAKDREKALQENGLQNGN